MSYQTDSWALAAGQVIKKFKQRGMDAYYCATKEEAKEKILKLMPKGSVVAAGGSESMAKAGVMEAVKSGDYRFIDRTAAKTPEETRRLFAEAVCADYFLMSTNAFTKDGELVNVDGMGNRVACLSYGPSHVIVLASMNKMCTTVENALERIHTLASPPNALRVNADTPCAKTGICADCLSPQCICCQTIVTRFSRISGRIIVVLTGEPLGF